jgi:hypothetical protein
MKIIRMSSTLVAQYVRVFVHMIRLLYLPTETERFANISCHSTGNIHFSLCVCVCVYIYRLLPYTQRSSTTLQPVADVSLKHSGNYMYHLFTVQKSCSLLACCIHVFHTPLVISSVPVAEEASDLHVSWFSLVSPGKSWEVSGHVRFIKHPLKLIIHYHAVILRYVISVSESIVK